MVHKYNFTFHFVWYNNGGNMNRLRRARDCFVIYDATMCDTSPPFHSVFTYFFFLPETFLATTFCFELSFPSFLFLYPLVCLLVLFASTSLFLVFASSEERQSDSVLLGFPNFFSAEYSQKQSANFRHVLL